MSCNLQLGLMDPHLLQGFRNGDRLSLDRVYRSEVAGVRKFLRTRLFRARRLNEAALADMVQEVFLRAFSERGRANYDGNREYRWYLIALTRNVFIDWVRRTSRETTATETLDSADSGATTNDDAPDSEIVEATTRYVDNVHPALREVWEHRFVRDESQLGAARSIGVSRQTLRRLERELLTGLRRALRRQYGLGHGDAQKTRVAASTRGNSNSARDR